MKLKLCSWIAGFASVLLVGAGTHASVIFDFGTGDVDAGTGVAANVVVAENALLSAGSISHTESGVQITITGIQAAAGDASTSTWGANSQGIGIRSLDSGSGTGVDQGGTGGARRRISGQVGESIQFSFDQDVTIETIRLGNFTNGEVAEINFVSGTDPFAGGSWTFNADGSQGPTTDLPVNVSVTAGTVLSITASTSLQGGVLWNDIVVTPEPASLALLGLGGLMLLRQPRRQ